MNLAIESLNTNCLTIIGLCCSLLLLFLEGIYASLIGPIYPLRAINGHEVSQTIVAITLAMFPIGEVTVAILLLIFDMNTYIRTIFISAGTSAALSIIAFGLVDSIKNVFIYQGLCMLNRFITGAATSGVWTMVFAVITTSFGELGKKVSNAFVSFFCTGATLGPQISLFLSTTFHYSTPFYISGALGLMCVLGSSTMFLQKHNGMGDVENSESNYFSSFKFLSDFGVIVLLLNLFCTFTTFGFFDGVLAQFFVEEIGVSSTQLNIVYAIISIPFLPSSLFFGCYLANKGYSFLVVFFCLALTSAVIFFIYLGSFIPLFKEFYITTSLLCFFGMTRTTVATAIFPVLTIYICKRFPSSNPVAIKVFVGSALVIISGIGFAFGSAFFIGFLKAFYGIYNSILGIWILWIFCTSNFVYFLL